MSKVNSSVANIIICSTDYIQIGFLHLIIVEPFPFSQQVEIKNQRPLSVQLVFNL